MMTWHLSLYTTMFLRVQKEHAAELLGQEPNQIFWDKSGELVGKKGNFIVNWSPSDT